MPLMNSVGALKIQKFNPKVKSLTNWLAITGSDTGTVRNFDYLKSYNNDIYINYSASGSDNDWWIKFDTSTGLPTYSTLINVPLDATSDQTCSTIDSSGNIHMMMDKRLMMYSSTYSFIQAITLTDSNGFTSLGFNGTTRMFSNSGYLYLIFNYTTSFRLIKIRISDYAVQWANTYNTGVTSSTSVNDPFNILFHSSGDLILVGGSNTGKNHFFLRVNTSGSIVWQKKRTFTGTSSTGPGTKSVLDSSGNLFVMSNIVNTGTNFTNILYKIDTSNGNKIAEQTLSTTSDYYQSMKIQGNYLYLATSGVGYPGPNIILTVIDTSFTGIQNHNINGPNMILGGLAVTSTNCYISYLTGAYQTVPVILKLPLDTNLTTSTPYRDGTLVITKISDVTATVSSSINLVAGTCTITSFTATTTAATDLRVVETPIKYVIGI